MQLVKVIVLLTVLILVSPIAIQLHPKQQRCFKVEGGNEYSIQFLVGGYQEENINFTITNDNKTVLEKTGIKEFRENVNLPTGSNKLCFIITDDYGKILMIDFYESTNSIKTLITKKDLNEVGGALRDAYTELKNVYRNQQFQIQRDKVHKDLLQETESKIKYTGILKVVMLLGSALVQVWVMKSFFNGRSRQYQSVAT